jgi:hypothetical protein
MTRSGSSLLAWRSRRSRSTCKRSQTPISSQREAAVSGPAGATQLQRDVLPAAAGRQNEPQDAEHDAVADVWSAALWSNELLGRQVIGGQVEERLRHLRCSHDRRLRRGATTCQRSSDVPREVLSEPVIGWSRFPGPQ